MSDFLISVEALRAALGGPGTPLIFDVRRRPVYDADDRKLPTARWRDHRRVEAWAGEVAPGAAVVVYCAHGHQLSQACAALLRSRGVEARALDGGIEAWRGQAAPTIRKDTPAEDDGSKPSRWVTRIRPKIDRIACSWFIRRFVDPMAQFLFVAPDQVTAAAQVLTAIPYDVEGVDFTHEGERCSFDIFLDRFGIDDPLLRDLATIVRGADTGRADLAPEAAGLLAMSLGLSVLAGGDDHRAVAQGMLYYDALYAWRRAASDETHGWPPKAIAA